MKYAAIDIGTNAARLLIGELFEEKGQSSVKKITYLRIPLRLGDDVFEDGRISTKKLEMFIKTISVFSLLAQIYDVKNIRAVATSAMRIAENSKNVIAEINAQTGVKIEVISGDEEAKLILGGFSLLNIPKKIAFIVIDVGGGSTEISVFENGKRIASKSFELGTIRILKGKSSPEIWSDLTMWITENIDVLEDHLLFGTGGNIQKAHDIIAQKENDSLSLIEIEKLQAELAPLSLTERMNRFSIKEERADVLVPALDIYIYILKELNIRTLQVPNIGLSDGMIYAMHKEELEK
jgi:exopolyphosphatase/guanosine-5'-triphosphate,3'-diphosphate pyrophosphatase